VTQQVIASGAMGRHVVKMVGCVTTRDPYCLVSELPPSGDLLTFLQHQRSLITEGSGGVQVTGERLMDFALQMATGMVCTIHYRPLVKHTEPC